MLSLHRRYFDGVCPHRFRADLAEKDWVILLHAEGGTLAGFSTQRVIRLEVGGRVRRFLFSGDTIVDRAHWNSPALSGAFGHLMLRLMDEFGEDDLYWFLIAKGYRAYRFLPVFFHRFWPAFDQETPPEAAALLDAVARAKFNGAYHPESGTIRLAAGDRLTEELADVPPSRRRDPHVSYFLARNPGYVLGHELACLAPIRRDNLNAYAWRVIRAAPPAWRDAAPPP
jgi:hypothetical protein